MSAASTNVTYDSIATKVRTSVKILAVTGHRRFPVACAGVGDSCADEKRPATLTRLSNTCMM